MSYDRGARLVILLVLVMALALLAAACTLGVLGPVLASSRSFVGRTFAAPQPGAPPLSARVGDGGIPADAAAGHGLTPSPSPLEMERGAGQSGAPHPSSLPLAISGRKGHRGGITAEATATAVPTPTPVPTVTVEEFWQRMRSIEYATVLDQLQVLPPDRRDDPLFGIDDALVEENETAPLLNGSGASIDRVEVRWDAIEPSPGDFQFDELDRLIAESEKWHLRVLAVVDGAPAWAVSDADRVGTGPPAALSAPAFLPTGAADTDNPWAFFLATVSRRYGARIGAWEIWNEPNFRDFWHGSPADYAQLLAVARSVLGQTVPGSPVLVGGMVEDDGAFLGAVVRDLCPTGTCRSPPFDAVAWHVYGNPDDVLTVVERTRAVLAAYRLQPRIWITEANVAVNDPAGPGDAIDGPDAVSLDQQAAFVARFYTLARAAGIQTAMIYRAADVDENRHYWGLLRADFTGRPALFAYRTAADWLSHTTFVRLVHPTPGVTWIALRRPGEDVNVLWSDDVRPSRVRIPARAATGLLVRCTGASGEIRASDGVFTVTLPAAPPRRPQTAPLGEPIYLVVRD